MLKKSQKLPKILNVTENLNWSGRKFAEQLVAKPSEERLSSLTILCIHKHTK